MSNIDVGSYPHGYYYTCDKCKRPMRPDEAPNLPLCLDNLKSASVPVTHSLPALEAIAKRAGWNVENRHLCPSCQTQPTLF